MTEFDKALDAWNDRMALQAHATDTTPKNPFELVDGRRGAPLGRNTFGTPPAAGIKLVRARWVDGAYDQGGAYWGAPARDFTGFSIKYEYIYAAVDTAVPCSYCAYVRAFTKEEALEKLQLTKNHLKKVK